MNQEIERDEITIDLTELFHVLWSKLHIIILAAIIMAVAAFAGTKLLMTPKYTSVTKVYVLTRQTQETVTVADFQIGNALTKDYMEMVKSRPVLEGTIDELNLDLKVAELESMITVESLEDTRILVISVENESPKAAKEIADVVREKASAQITDIMEVDAVNVVEEGNLPEKPSSPSMKKNTVLGGMFGAALVIGILILIYMLDDTIKTPRDVEEYMGLNVLTSIPIQEGGKKSEKVKKSSTKKMMRNMKNKKK